MKKLIYIIVLLTLPMGIIFAQSTNGASMNQPGTPSAVKYENVVKRDTVQTGTGSIEYGKSVVQFNEKAKHLLSTDKNNSAYYVTITPECSNCGQFSVSEKGAQSFTVQQSSGISTGLVTFKYFVYTLEPRGNSK